MSLCTAIFLMTSLLAAEDTPRRFAISTVPTDVIATGNEWIALPTIRVTDGALMNFNVLSMRDRGLLQVSGEGGEAVLKPQFTIGQKTVQPHDLSWELIEYWIPTAHFSAEGADMTLTWCAPQGSRSAFLRLTVTNRTQAPLPVSLGLRASWGALQRVTYLPVALRGERTASPSPWVDPSTVFSFLTDDTKFAWSLIYPGSQASVDVPPVVLSPTLRTTKSVTLAPGEKAEALYVLGAGLEEFSAPHNAKSLREELDRSGADAILSRAAAWCHKRTRTTGQPDLDLLMNRNFLFTANYAWGRTIDTEQLVGVTSRSPRYYVSAAYWDRDAMLWSFPGLLDIDPELARQALDYALGIQLHNTGTHSRFIDGVVLEDGFQLDEAVAPLIAAGEYLRVTGDVEFLRARRGAINLLRDRLLERYDPTVGMYSSLQDPQDEYQKLPFLTYDNALTWKALGNLGEIFERLGDRDEAARMRQRATELKRAILRHAITDKAPGAGGEIFASATDGNNFAFTEMPPGSLMRMASLGFISEDDPVFNRTYEWLHSKNYPYSYADQTYGLPGSYRLVITTSWEVADHLRLKRGRDLALKILRASPWDGGIITEGMDPATAHMDAPGGAFATAAGYVADALCQVYCQPRP